jgi:hypothetical protein
MGGKPNPQNLKPWKPGQSGNPGGAKKGVQQLKKLNPGELKGIIDIVMKRDVAALEEFKKNKKNTVLEMWIASVALEGIRKGDPFMLDKILERTVGKVKEEIKHEGLPDNSPRVVVTIPSNGSERK